MKTTMAEAVAVRDKHFKLERVRKDGVLGTGIGMGKHGHCIVVYVRNGAAAKLVPSTVDGVWTRTEVVDEIVATALDREWDSAAPEAAR